MGGGPQIKRNDRKNAPRRRVRNRHIINDSYYFEHGIQNDSKPYSKAKAPLNSNHPKMTENEGHIEKSIYKEDTSNDESSILNDDDSS